jgi:hypothetical protein
MALLLFAVGGFQRQCQGNKRLAALFREIHGDRPPVIDHDDDAFRGLHFGIGSRKVEAALALAVWAVRGGEGDLEAAALLGSLSA